MIHNQRGSALLIVMTAIYSLFMIGLGLQAIIGSDLERAVQFRNATQAHFIAKAGSRVALQRLQSQDNSFDALNQGWYNNAPLYKEASFDGGSFTLFHYGDQGETFYGMCDEESKVHLNKAPLAMLAALPGMNRARAEAIVHYREKKPFATPTELLTLFTHQPDLFDGRENTPDLQSLTTVWGSGKINLNTASKVVLATLPGLNAAQADIILLHRRGPDRKDGTDDDQPFHTLEELRELHLISDELWPIFTQFATVRSTAFSFVSQGKTHSRALTTTATIQAVVERLEKKIKITYWKTW